MPTIPVYRQQTTASAASTVGPPRNPQAESAGLLALARVAERFGQLREEEAAADAALKISTAQTEWQQQFIERGDKAPPGAYGFATGFLRDYDGAVRQVASSGKTRAARDFIRERLAVTNRAHLAQAAFKFEHERRLQHRDSMFEEGVRNMATASELQPNLWQERLAEQLTALDEMDAGPVEKQERRIAALEAGTRSAAIGFMRQDPDGTLERLLNPKENDTLFRALSPKAREAALNEYEAFQRMQVQQENLAYTRAERAEHDVEEAASKEGDSLLANGQLNAAWIERNRERLAPDDFRFFYRQLSGGEGGPRNVERYIDLRHRASLGQDIRAEARNAFRSDEIGLDDYDRLIGEVEADRPGWYKRGTQFLSSASGYSEINPTPDRGLLRANMLDDWQAWSVRNPKATDEDATREYRRIANEYAVLDREKISMTLRRPLYMTDRNIPDLDEIERRTAEAYEKGEIDRAEAERQALLLQQWREAYRPTIPPN